jgi:uncharacterized protein YbjQ (UPF0145 family)
MMTSTTGDIAGFTTVKNLGVVHAMAVRAVGAAGNIMGGVQALVGGNLSAYSEVDESARKEAFDKLGDRAGQMGANAVIGVHIQTQGFTAGVLEVLCYGTAVLVQPAT